ncbi:MULTISPECIES: DUF707 domain-containing protein [unclassified Rhizobium]|uniref:DUF707 domain-containing protein n=1 Tax=unclassified Rhizobium TaxID=2613769 RepID=UPI001ADCE382|nr:MULTISPECIES: DUF707 domain-containing protein [unclassified Rhizobium]MBO9098772.1 DUF707 domain-containing protein [Rhizobium sp. L58/93]MBO9169038.1 DUF707 domain-containing protein [Rhizobium sp. L245/93]MBO9184988.1 DUF707 domain-containing protein [Rhizobium sp. E27B/91]QXZ85147.1 DUF707 domain-containing protein [Rhizobium sp. K1/93]QXZ90714.1 DUF707 domain-containing protein [Rhizobium sp. K15/93]
MLASTRENTASDFLAGLSESDPVTEEMLTGTFWQFADLERGTLSPFLVLAPGGLVGNFFNASTDYWQVVNGLLCFIDETGLPSIVFNVSRMEGSKVALLAGRGVVDGVVAIYMLTSTPHPEHPMFATQLSHERNAKFLVQPANGPKRPNLVVVPANSKSLHPRWFDGLDAATRSWDLCVGYYGAEDPVVESPFEYLAHLPKRKKFRLISDLFYEGSPLWGYDRVWLPDDDLLCDGDTVNRMFHLSRKHGLELAQPSLKQGPGCFPNHPITIQRPNSILRHEGFIEIMCPIFSKAALKICIGSMRDAESGYGLDHLWPAFLGRPANRMAIIDAVGVAHTRPLGATYNVQAAVDEQAALFNSYRYTPVKMQGVW